MSPNPFPQCKERHLIPVTNVVFQPVLFTPSICNKAYFRDRSAYICCSDEREAIPPTRTNQP